MSIGSKARARCSCHRAGALWAGTRRGLRGLTLRPCRSGARGRAPPLCQSLRWPPTRRRPWEGIVQFWPVWVGKLSRGLRQLAGVHAATRSLASWTRRLRKQGCALSASSRLSAAGLLQSTCAPSFHLRAHSSVGSILCGILGGTQRALSWPQAHLPFLQSKQVQGRQSGSPLLIPAKAHQIAGHKKSPCGSCARTSMRPSGESRGA